MSAGLFFVTSVTTILLFFSLSSKLIQACFGFFAGFSGCSCGFLRGWSGSEACSVGVILSFFVLFMWWILRCIVLFVIFALIMLVKVCGFSTVLFSNSTM